MNFTTLLRKIDLDGEFVTGDDGYVCFWPTGNKGAFLAHHLRAIAVELDRRNEVWDKEVDEYFEKD